MKCPSCKTENLEYIEETLGLKCYSCSKCGGNWVRFDDYTYWKNQMQFTGEIININEDYTTEYDSKMAHLCPDCGVILIKFNVQSNLPFRIDHCGSCNGVWLDKNEWEILIKNNLHQKMDEIFTGSWQQNLKNEMTRQRMEEHYIKKFGSEDFEKLKSIRDWVRSNKNRDQFLAFLADNDPYKL